MAQAWSEATMVRQEELQGRLLVLFPALAEEVAGLTEDCLSDLNAWLRWYFNGVWVDDWERTISGALIRQGCGDLLAVEIAKAREDFRGLYEGEG